MDGQRSGKDRFNPAEADFRAKVVRLKAMATELGMHPLLVGLVDEVLIKGYLNERYPEAEAKRDGVEDDGSDTDAKKERIPRLVPGWDEYLETHPDLRDEWRQETLIRVGLGLIRGTILEESDEDHPHLGGRFRVFCEYKAIKAQWHIWKERGVRGKKAELDAPVPCLGEHMENVPDKKEPRQKEVAEIQLALAMAIDKLENPRQRAVMRLSLRGYDYQEIKDMLIAKNDEIGRNLTYEKVRYAHEKGLEALRKWFRPPAA